MCGIVGYVGPRPSQAILLAGLSRLEYRGYDSAGIAVIDGDGDARHAQARRQARRAARRPRRRRRSPTARPASATPAGRPTAVRPTRNAHPHLADDDKLAVIHNGIIENFAELKAELLADGYTFRSETDTEVAAVLLGREYRGTAATSSPRSAPSSAASRARSRCSRCTRTSPGSSSAPAATRRS